MLIKEESKGAIIENANEFILPEEIIKEEEDKRKYFKIEFSKEKISKLDKEHYFQGKGIKKGNFTYELEWNSKCLGSIGGGSVYKFGYEENFNEIKKLIIKILSARDSIEQFYTADGELTQFSKEIIKDTDEIKGLGRAFIGKLLSIYFPNIFINIFGHQDIFLEKIYHDYKPETRGLDLFIRNNYLLLDIKNKYASDLSNNEFEHLLYKTFEIKEIKKADQDMASGSKIEALEVQHYQSLIHRNFDQIFKGTLKYYDYERQNEKNGQVNTEEVGIMDFLAIDQNKDLVVIELKRNSTDKTLGQVLRYMGWVKKNLGKKDQKVSGMIIAETKDNRLDYALTVVPNVIFKRMKLNVEIED